MFESGIATKENIDKAMEVGCGYPMGPFALMDFIGLDHVYTVAEHLYQECQDQQFFPPPLLKRLVEAGNLGKKSGKGFYKYS
jgi:3-hydroxybutyryl-CoA dehydrogenase